MSRQHEVKFLAAMYRLDGCSFWLLTSFNGRHRPRQRLLLSNERPRLAAMLLQQLHIGDSHTPVDGFAHVVDGQQGELDGGGKSGDSPRTDP